MNSELNKKGMILMESRIMIMIQPNPKPPKTILMPIQKNNLTTLVKTNRIVNQKIPSQQIMDTMEMLVKTMLAKATKL